VNVTGRPVCTTACVSSLNTVGATNDTETARSATTGVTRIGSSTRASTTPALASQVHAIASGRRAIIPSS
jgi:hypothetical protein